MSDPTGTITHMFEELALADDAGLVDVIDAATRAEATAAARRFAAIAELVGRHADGPTDCARWSCDNWDAIAAQIGAALNISHHQASYQMDQAMSLRDRLPAVGALFAEGRLSLRLVTAIIWRTGLIKDPAVLRVVDATLANDALHYGSLSVPKTERAIDAVVDRYDPVAVRRSQTSARSREVVITPAGSGTAGVSGLLLATDAAVLDQRLNDMAYQVCAQDPRTIAQRRADALGTLAAGGQALACQCPEADCPARVPDERASAVVIHVVTDAAALDVAPDPRLHGETPPEPINADSEPARTRLAFGQILGGVSVPAAQLGALAAAGAQVAPLDYFTETEPAPGYRIPAAMARFVRCRDMTCRFPGCDRPAVDCDVDHAIAYPFGLTHPSNLRCLCRKHHLLKTFWTGLQGWRDRQQPDATIIWTDPTGHTWTTRPGSRLLFPTLCLPTSAPRATNPPDSPRRTLMMPTRLRTRAQDRDYRIDTERARNQQTLTTRRIRDAQRALETDPIPKPPAETQEAPPF